MLFGPAQVVVWGATRAGLRIAPSFTLRIQLAPVTTLDSARLVRDMDAVTLETYIDVYRTLWSGRGFVCDLGHRSDSSESIGQPALIMSSANDPSVPAQHVARLAALCSNSKQVMLDAESHFIWIGRAAEVAWQRRLEIGRAHV